MPNLNGRLKTTFGTLCIGIVFALALLNPAPTHAALVQPCVTCQAGWTCVSWSGGCCTRCEPGGLPCGGLLCREGHILNPITCECECNSFCKPGFVMNTATCECECDLRQHCLPGTTLNPETCKCEANVKPVCVGQAGEYLDSVNGVWVCTKCPPKAGCIVRNSDPNSTLTTGPRRCYATNCNVSDTSGKYTYTEDCFYNNTTTEPGVSAEIKSTI